MEQSFEMDSEGIIEKDKRVGFYQLVQDAQARSMIGALLVLDELGKPEEFRVSFPVKPTTIQKQLYGESLLPHIGIDLCGKPLFESLKQAPALLVLGHSDFMGLSELVDIPTVYLEPTGESIVVSSPTDAGGPRTQKLQSASGRFDPVNVNYPTKYSQNDCARTAQLVSDFFAGIDLLEPFNRINIAIQTLRTQDERFR